MSTGQRRLVAVAACAAVASAAWFQATGLSALWRSALAVPRAPLEVAHIPSRISLPKEQADEILAGNAFALPEPLPPRSGDPPTAPPTPATCDFGFVRLIAASHERSRSEEHTSELQSQSNLVCRLLLEKK